MHNKFDVHGNPIGIRILQSRIGGKGHGKGSRDKFIGQSGVGVGGGESVEIGGTGCLGSCEEGHVGSLVERFDKMAGHKSIDHECGCAHGSSVAIDELAALRHQQQQSTTASKR